MRDRPLAVIEPFRKVDGRFSAGVDRGLGHGFEGANGAARLEYRDAVSRRIGKANLAVPSITPRPRPGEPGQFEAAVDVCGGTKMSRAPWAVVRLSLISGATTLRRPPKGRRQFSMMVSRIGRLRADQVESPGCPFPDPLT